jgi:hypothetical protein
VPEQVLTYGAGAALERRSERESEAGAEAMRFDGVRPETLVQLVES